MSATLVSSNTTIKVNAALNPSTVTSSTLYTAPANGYAIITLNLIQTAGTTTVFVAGRRVASGAGNFYGVYVGPSQAVSCTIGTGQVDIVGVEFVNTP